ncbi:tetratricopeptide repeat protein [Streptomyces sp. NPDC006692]|uniref:alpha/beta hydrolase n=1 Tax=Streptomyces sp. NPDC006692 TaxID=3364758 RepID=UPI003687CAAE
MRVQKGSALVGDGQLGVVLVHGFNSGPETWGHVQERIKQDQSLGAVRLLSFHYATGVAKWGPIGLRVFPKISTIADSLKEYLRTEGGPFDDLVIITHSMGGLVVQRYLERMLTDGHGSELARIRRVVMLACPNDGSELLRSLRHAVFGRRGRNPQERELRPLNKEVAETRRVIVNQVLRATAITDRTCPVPFFVYAGESDGIVSVESARSVFSDAAALPGDHFSILEAVTPEHRTFTTLRRHLHETVSARSGADQPPGKAPDGPARSAGPEEVVRPRQVGVIPPRAGAFQDRAERARLRRAVAGGGTAVLGQVTAAQGVQDPDRGQMLSGMGGVGKTQLAADHARSALTGGEVDLLVWVTAADRTSLVAGLGRAGIEIAGAQPGDLKAAAEAFTAWLEPKAGQEAVRWLVVLDDVSDTADLEGLWPPASPHGRTLITTRRRDAAFAHDGRTRIDVGVFTEAEAVSYLGAVLAVHGRSEPAEQLAALAEDLGHLPLALSQAAAFMADADMGVSDYRVLLADRTGSLAEASPQPLPPGHTREMASAWDLSIGRAARMRPAGLAPLLLHLAAFLDPNGIPAAVLATSPALTYLAQERASSAGLPLHDPASADATTREVTEREVTAGLRVLHRLSLIDHTPDVSHREVRIHALIQRAVRDTLTTEQYHNAARTAADALMAAWPDVERDTVLAQTLRAGATVLATHAEATLHQPRAHDILNRIGRSFGEFGQVTAAVTYYQSLAGTTRHHLGPDHPDTLAARHNLARSHGEAGDVAGAVTAFAELLDDYVRVLGPDSPHTLAARHDAAFWRGEAGDAGGAVTAFAELLDDRLRVLGPDHPDTLNTRHNLAYSRGHAGDAAGAVTVFAELLDDQLRVLGPDHPHALATRLNLAFWRGHAGDAGGAVTAFAELLDDYVQVLGPDHPHTLAARHNLARSQGEAGDVAGAVTAFAELLDDRLRVLGPDHPHTLKTRNALAHLQERSGEGLDSNG